MKFPGHGQLSAICENNILVIEGTGPWNIEMLSSTDEEATKMLQELYLQPWAVLAIMHGNSTFLPDAAKKLQQIIRQEKTHNRVATAIIVTYTAHPSFSKAHLASIYQLAGETFEFFTNKEAAMDWLTRQLCSPENKKTS
ncbi:hypothetical protein [Aliiglaciecola sp. LCG003]|uniref:hypothetical protein n=1 Tax=Aliiglaciecola sp. LCG003 TaxID=3053655 RepID=UPI0025735E31|nr:hypothetical protein [Aliiglaciecola sp. LCG003]WJG08805.1 hypothetical protein QR722_15890 [Aliiglaciecola sp. LCG003]